MAVPPGLGVLTTDAELRVQSWNEWLAVVTGLGEADVRGRLITDVVPPDRRELLQDILGEVLATGMARVLAPAFHRYLFLCPPSQASRHYSEMQQATVIAPLQGDGGIVGAMITIEDVTARLDRERDLAASLQAGAGDLPVPSVIAAVGAEDWRVRSAAVRALKQSATREEVGHLLNSLQRDHQDLNVLSSALQVLTAMHREVTGPLVELLSDDSPNLRMHAALALGALGDAAGVPGLVAALEDEDANVRFHAIEALGRLRAPEAIEPLARVAGSGDFFLAFPAVDALAKIDDSRVVPSLIGLLDQELLRPAIVDALAVLGDEESVAPLVTLLNEGGAEVAAVAEALRRIADRYERLFGAGQQIVDLSRRAMAEQAVARLAAALRGRKGALPPLVVVLGWVGRPALDALVSVVGEPAVDAALEAALVALGSAAVEPLEDRLAHGEPHARVSAAQLLGRLGDRRAAGSLAGALSSPDSTLVSAAASALASLGEPRVLDALLPLFGHPQAAVRQAVIAAVNSIGAAATPGRIRTCLGDADPRVRECAIRVAGYFGFAEGVEGILAGLRDPSEDVRRAAIEQLPVLDDSRAVPLLLVALREETARNRGAAAHALRAVDGPAVEPALRAALDDPDAWVRYFAAGSLGLQGSDVAVDDLARVARADRAPHVQIAAIQALGRVGPAAVAAVASELVAAGDDELASAALTALAQAAGTEADALLLQAAESPRLALRTAALQTLAQRGTTQAAERLAWAVRVPDQPALARVAIAGLRAVAASADAEGRSAAVTHLVGLATDPVRRDEVADLLASLPDHAITILADELVSSPRQHTRVLIVDALARMRRPAASDTLLSALHDDDASVRAAAVAAFGRLGSLAAAPLVEAIRASDPDPAVRRRAAVVCARFGWGTGDAAGRR